MNGIGYSLHDDEENDGLRGYQDDLAILDRLSDEIATEHEPVEADAESNPDARTGAEPQPQRQRPLRESGAIQRFEKSPNSLVRAFAAEHNRFVDRSAAFDANIREQKKRIKKEQKARKQQRAAEDPFEQAEARAQGRLRLLKLATKHCGGNSRAQQLQGREEELVTFAAAMELAMLKLQRMPLDREIATEFASLPGGFRCSKDQARGRRLLVERLAEDVWATVPLQFTA